MLDYKKELDTLSNQKEWYLKYPELSPLIEDWPIPSKVELEGKNLIYDITKYGQVVAPDQATMRKKILGGFLELAEANDNAILEYARTWGVLGLCKHGLPAAHQIIPDPRFTKFVLERPGCTIRRKGNWLYEPLERWRHYARQFRSIVALAIDLRKARAMDEEQFRKSLINLYLAIKASDDGLPYDKKILEPHFIFTAPKRAGIKHASITPKVEVSSVVPGKQEDWQIVLQDYWDGTISSISPDPVIGARHILCNVINKLFNLSGVHPRLGWTYETSFTLAGRAARGFLFPTLAVQLMLLINGSPDYALCSSCGKPILLRKGQSINRKSYCKDCGLKAARREAVKKYYKQERSNPERKKRKRLAPKEVIAIQRALKKSKPGLVKELAERYGVSEWAIYKIREGKTGNKTQ